MSIIWQIFKMPTETLVHEEKDSRDVLQKQIEHLAYSTLSPLALVEPEYTENFQIWCLLKGESSATYQMILIDDVTKEVFRSTFCAPARPQIILEEFSRSDSLASSINSISGNTVNANLPEAPFS